MSNHHRDRSGTVGLIAGAAIIVAACIGSAQTARADGPQRTPTCRGQIATHVNEDGTSSDDVIVVDEPGIDIRAWSGDDLICVRTPDTGYGATVRGDNGRDTIITTSGFNSVYGGSDGDSLLSNSADHLLDGEEGNDTIYIGAEPDGTVYGGDGNDRIFGSGGDDSVQSGPGRDLVMGFGGDDELDGGADADRLVGGNGTDELDGGAGHDECVDAAAPATSFVSCETVVAVLGGGPGGFAFG